MLIFSKLLNLVDWQHTRSAPEGITRLVFVWFAWYPSTVGVWLKVSYPYDKVTFWTVYWSGLSKLNKLFGIIYLLSKYFITDVLATHYPSAYFNFIHSIFIWVGVRKSKIGIVRVIPNKRLRIIHWVCFYEKRSQRLSIYVHGWKKIHEWWILNVNSSNSFLTIQ